MSGIEKLKDFLNKEDLRKEAKESKDLKGNESSISVKILSLEDFLNEVMVKSI